MSWALQNWRISIDNERNSLNWLDLPHLLTYSLCFSISSHSSSSTKLVEASLNRAE